MSYYQCPVCYFPKMTHPPNDYYICPCCATEFEADDFETTHEQLRNQWLENGAQWFSRAIPRPANWNPYLQLARAQNIFPKSNRVTKQTFRTVRLGKSISHPQRDVTVLGHWQILENLDGVRIART